MKRSQRITIIALIGIAAGAMASAAAAQDESKEKEKPHAVAPHPGPAPQAAAPRAGEHHFDARDPLRRDPRFERAHDIDRERAIIRMHEHDFHVRDVRFFTPYELARWRGGHWHQDWFNGRYGWWYDVGGVWYPYAVPAYPFPMAVAPLTLTVGIGG